MNLLDPTRFQGHHRTRNYFEGWYFKIVAPEQQLAYAFIPGISYDREGVGHAFLQVLDGVKAESSYHRYEVEEFRPARDRFFLQLGPHEFSAEHMRIQLPNLAVDVSFAQLHPWKKRFLAPGIMGWYGFVPRMQCYHGLVSYHHRLSGKLNGIDLSGGVGYTEKDWGSGFPEAWVWCQSNHLSGTGQPASLMASVASIPWLGSSFIGFLCTFLFEGKTRLFTTWARSQGQAKIGSASVVLSFRNPTHRIEITGVPAPGGDLLSPIAGAMTGKINESLRAELSVRFWEGEQLVYSGTASWAGLEVSANAAERLQ